MAAARALRERVANQQRADKAEARHPVRFVDGGEGFILRKSVGLKPLVEAGLIHFSVGEDWWEWVSGEI